MSNRTIRSGGRNMGKRKAQADALKKVSPIVHVATMYVCPACGEFFAEVPNYTGKCPECGFKPKGSKGKGEKRT